MDWWEQPDPPLLVFFFFSFLLFLDGGCPCDTGTGVLGGLGLARQAPEAPLVLLLLVGGSIDPTLSFSLSLFTHRFAGEQFAVFRDWEGHAHVVNAYCPHLGANLAVGGRVVDNCIECPFHGWQFHGKTGRCTRIPYAEKGECCGVAFWFASSHQEWVVGFPFSSPPHSTT